MSDNTSTTTTSSKTSTSIKNEVDQKTATNIVKSSTVVTSPINKEYDWRNNTTLNFIGCKLEEFVKEKKSLASLKSPSVKTRVASDKKAFSSLMTAITTVMTVSTTEACDMLYDFINQFKTETFVEPFYINRGFNTNDSSELEIIKNTGFYKFLYNIATGKDATLPPRDKLTVIFKSDVCAQYLVYKDYAIKGRVISKFDA